MLDTPSPNKKLIAYSEIFAPSFQGEGNHTGKATAWIRFFKCNLQCDGFGQTDPTDKRTYILPYKDLDISQYDSISQLPVFEYGCDSSYSWSAKFKRLVHKNTAATICNKIQNLLKHQTNPEGKFVHPKTQNVTHLAFTGGEPMLSQYAIVDIINTFLDKKNFPKEVTVETNGTQPLSPAIINTIMRYYSAPDAHWFWSISPKLFTSSGEMPQKAIRPEIVAAYAEYAAGQLKFVVTGSTENWDELDETVEIFKSYGIDFPVYIMPVGATKEQQEQEVIANIAVEGMKRGYHFSGRLHSYVFGNQIGT